MELKFLTLLCIPNIKMSKNSSYAGEMFIVVNLNGHIPKFSII